MQTGRPNTAGCYGAEVTKPPEALCALLEGALKAPLPARERSLIWGQLANVSRKLATSKNFDNRRSLVAQIKKIENETSKLHHILQKFDDADFIKIIRRGTDEIEVQLEALREIAEPLSPSTHQERYRCWVHFFGAHARRFRKCHREACDRLVERTQG
jgi:septal ring factor EnvC (AmiA/AmiB activator)